MPDNDTAETMVRGRGKPPKERPEQREAPQVNIVDDVYKDPRKKVIDDFILSTKEERGWTSDQVQKWLENIHFYFSMDIDHVNKHAMEADGYVPAMVTKEDGSKKQVTDRGDLLWMIDRNIAQARMEAPGRLAQDQLADVLQGQDSKFMGVRPAPDS